MSTTFTINGTDWEWAEEAQVSSDIMVKHVINVPSIPSRANVPAGRIGPTITLTGWEMRVTDEAGVQIHFVPVWKDLSFQKVLSQEGTGSVTLDLNDAIFDAVGDSNVLTHEFRWEVFWNSKHVFTFMNEDIGEEHVNEDGSKTITMSGRGIAKLLEHGIVLPPGYPTSWPVREWDWIGVTAMEAFLDLYAAVVARFATVGQTFPISVAFSDTQDSGSNNWTDDLDMTFEPGDNLLAALTRLAAYATGPDDLEGDPEPADWIVQPDGTLEVGAPYGNRLENLVRFQVANDQVAVSRSKTRKDVRNAVYVESGDTDIGEAVDAGSMTTWGRREVYIQNGDAPDWVAATEHATRAARLVRNEATQITISVLPNTVDRLVFFDYDVGDWIGIDSDDPKITGTYRIVSISISVDESAGTIVELGCQSLLQVYEARLAKAIETGGGSGSLTAAGSGIPQAPSSPTQIIEAATTSAYAPALPTPTGLSTTAGANENVSYIDVSWSGTAAGMTAADPIAEYEVEVTRTLPTVGQVRYVRVKAGTPAAGSPDPRTTRIEPVEPGATYSITVRAISRLGRISTVASTSRAAVGDATVPDNAGTGGWSVNAGLKVSAGLRSAVVTWDEHPDPDVKNGNGAYDVQIDTSPTFNTAPHPTGDLQGVRVSGTITSFSNLKAFTTYYVRVRAVDSSGNVSAYTTGSVSATTIRADTVDIGPDAITAPLIKAGEITSDKISVTGLDAAHIKFGEMDGDRITAHTLNANRIEASSLDVTVSLAVGGVIRTDYAFTPTDHRWISIDGSGVRFITGASTAYGAGTTTMFFDTATGSITINNATVTGRINVQNLSTFAGGIDASTATITGGTLQTSSNTSAARVVIDSTGLKAFPSGGGANPNLEFLTSTGQLTLRGNITSTATITGGSLVGASLISPSVGASNRVEIDSAGIRGISGGSTTFNYTTSNGNLALTGGNISGATISGGTITGGTIQTSSSNPKIIMDSTSFRAINSGGTTVTTIGAGTNPGRITTSDIRATGGEISNLEVNGVLTMDGSGLLRTADSGERVEISNANFSQVRWYNSAGSLRGTIHSPDTPGYQIQGEVGVKYRTISGTHIFGDFESQNRNVIINGELSVLSQSGGTITTGSWIEADNAVIRQAWFDGNYATFSHTNRDETYSFGYGQASDGHCLISTNDSIRLRRDVGDGDYTLAVFDYVGLVPHHKNAITFGGAEVDFRAWIPILGGATAIWATGSGQFGYASSTERIKENIRDLSGARRVGSGPGAMRMADADSSPVWDLRPRRFRWREDKVGNAAEYNERVPEGFAGLIVEEMAPLMPDAVHYDAEGNLVAWDSQVMMGYVIDALQEVREENIELRRRLQAIEVGKVGGA